MYVFILSFQAEVCTSYANRVLVPIYKWVVDNFSLFHFLVIIGLRLKAIFSICKVNLRSFRLLFNAAVFEEFIH